MTEEQFKQMKSKQEARKRRMTPKPEPGNAIVKIRKAQRKCIRVNEEMRRLADQRRDESTTQELLD